MSCSPCSLSSRCNAALRSPTIVARTRMFLGLFIMSLLSAEWLPAAETTETNLADFKAAQRRCQWSVERSMAATVGIINPDLAGPNALGHGSGVVVSEDGIILTAAH